MNGRPRDHSIDGYPEKKGENVKKKILTKIFSKYIEFIK
jgi:hypothetical protein